MIKCYSLIGILRRQRATGHCPSELWLCFELKTQLSILKPPLNDNFNKSTVDMQCYKNSLFSVGDKVMVRNHQKVQQWLLGKIEKILSSCMYLVVGKSRRKKKNSSYKYN